MIEWEQASEQVMVMEPEDDASESEKEKESAEEEARADGEEAASPAGIDAVKYYLKEIR